MNDTTIIRKPLVTEKNTLCSDMFHRYGFVVDRKASKPQIKGAVERLYNVRVVKVATQNRRGVEKRNKFGYWQDGVAKLAFVTIHPEDKIELF